MLRKLRPSQDLTAIGLGRVALSDGLLYSIAVAKIGGSELRVRRRLERRALARDEVTRFIDAYVAGYSQERQPQWRNRFKEVTAPSFLPTHIAFGV